MLFGKLRKAFRFMLFRVGGRASRPFSWVVSPVQPSGDAGRPLVFGRPLRTRGIEDMLGFWKELQVVAGE